jgi:hypothetical protein
MSYFDRGAKRNEGLNQYTRILMSLFFFFSIAAVLGHFIGDIFLASARNEYTISKFLVVSAISFPVLAAGIRTLRSAYEFARHACIFRAKYVALKQYDEQSQEEVKKDTLDGEAILKILWHCEQLLELEQREWLRLMIETEGCM